MKPISAAVFLFDMDGTLIDSSRPMERVWGRFARRHGLELAALLPTIHGVRALDTVQRLALPGVDPLAEAKIIEREEVEDVDGVTPIAGALEFLAALPPDRWTVVTSAPKALARARLGAAGVPIPASLVTGEDVLAGKPAPDCYILGAKRLSCAPADCIVFEDAAAGIASAIAAGAEVVVIASGQGHQNLSDRLTVRDYHQLELVVEPNRLHVRIVGLGDSAPCVSRLV